MSGTHPIYIAALFVLAGLSLTAILSRVFNDNLIQRVGLAMTCFGAVLRIWTLLQGQDLDPTRYMLTYGVTLFGLGSALNIWRQKRAEQSRKRRLGDL